MILCILSSRKSPLYLPPPTPGTHSLTKTHGYAVMAHADSSADGSLETILFYRPVHCPFQNAQRYADREDFRPGHGWFFVAGAIYDMPRTRGEGCLIWVASCNPDPLYHGTLPTFKADAIEKRSLRHDGMGSALLCQSNVVGALVKRRGGDGGNLNNVKARGVPASIAVCPKCLGLCRGACFPELKDKRPLGAVRLEQPSGAPSSSAPTEHQASTGAPSVNNSSSSSNMIFPNAPRPNLVVHGPTVSTSSGGPSVGWPVGIGFVPPSQTNQFRRKTDAELAALQQTDPEGAVQYLLRLSETEERERVEEAKREDEIFLEAIAESTRICAAQQDLIVLSDSEDESDVECWEDDDFFGSFVASSGAPAASSSAALGFAASNGAAASSSAAVSSSRVAPPLSGLGFADGAATSSSAAASASSGGDIIFGGRQYAGAAASSSRAAPPPTGILANDPASTSLDVGSLRSGRNTTSSFTELEDDEVGRLNFDEQTAYCMKLSQLTANSGGSAGIGSNKRKREEAEEEQLALAMRLSREDKNMSEEEKFDLALKRSREEQ